MRDLLSYKSNIWKSYIRQFLGNFDLFAGILIPFFTIFGGISFTEVMVLQAIFAGGIFLLEIPTGAVADKWGRKSSLILSSLIGVIGILIYISYPNFWVFALGEIVLAMGVALRSGADHSMVYDSLREIKKEKKSKKIFGQFESSGLIALMIAAPIGSWIAGMYGLRFAFGTMIVPYALSFFVSISLKEPEIGRKLARKRKYGKTIRQGFHYLKHHPALRIMALDMISVSVLAFFLVWFYQVKLQELGLDVKYFGFVHAGIVLVQIIILNSFGVWEKLFRGKRRYILAAGILTGISYIVIAFSQDIRFAVGAMLFAAAFGLTRKPLFQNYMNKFIKSAERSTVLSTISMFYALSMAILNIFLGMLVDWNLKYTLVGLGVAIIVFSVFTKLEEEHLKD